MTTMDIIAREKTLSKTTESHIKKTVCPYCGVGCGVTAEIQDNNIIAVSGDKDHPANAGKLCVKGSNLHLTLGDKRRILEPRIAGKNTSWETAVHTVAERFNDVIAKHGPDATAFYLSGQLLTEDYYIANKLMKGFMGSGNVDTNSRLCMAAASSAYKRAFGEDTMPCSYEDFNAADTILIAGSNPAYAHPIVFQRMVQAKKDNPNLRIVVVDPRRTATCESADLHLAIKPGTDAWFFNGLLAYLSHHQHVDMDFVNAHCHGFDEALSTAKKQQSSVEEVAHTCDVTVDDLLQCYQWFARSKKAITVYSMGINQSSSSVDKANSIINCHLACGAIGIPGAGPFSITGQPNAMGGREVGGLATELAAHMKFANPDDIDRVSRFWHADNMAQKEGLKALDMFKAVETGKIKAIWIMATNPVVSMPDANFIKAALEKCDFVVVSECYENSDTLQYADVVLPATTWAEKQGMVTNSDRHISLQKGIIPAPGLAKNDWQIIRDVAQAMGFNNAFNYTRGADIFREHAALSGFENTGTRQFDISALSHMSDADYENFTPTPWPINARYPQGKKRLYTDGVFASNADGKARFLEVNPRLPQIAAKPQQLIMNTGRIRDQWHTMTRTGRSPKLMGHIEEPFIQIHPRDASQHNLQDGQLARLTNRNAEYLARVRVSEQQRVGEVFVPIHWNGQFSASARASALVNPIVDPLCGQPEYKHTPVNIEPFKHTWSGLIVSVNELTPYGDYWTKVSLEQGVKYVVAGSNQLDTNKIKAMAPHIHDWVVLQDTASSTVSMAGFVDHCLMFYFSAAPTEESLIQVSFIESQLNTVCDYENRYRLLAGRDVAAAADTGPIICSCFQVGKFTIQEAINSGRCTSVEALGEALKCGTNCGSCIPELKMLL